MKKEKKKTSFPGLWLSCLSRTTDKTHFWLTSTTEWKMVPVQLNINRTNITCPSKSKRPHLTLYVLWLFHQQGADEVPGFLWDMCESVLVKLPVTLLDVLQGVKVILSSEGRQTAQPGRNTIFFGHHHLTVRPTERPTCFILTPSQACWLLGDWIWTSCETHRVI